MQQIKAVLRGPEGVRKIDLDPNANITLWQADGSAVPGVSIPSSLLSSVRSLSSGQVQPLRMLIWVLKINLSGTITENCTIGAHCLDGTMTNEFGSTVAVYRQVS